MELSADFLWFVLIGLAAQLVDGALGMAYGLVSSSILLGLGLPPAATSASIHTAEVFTTGVSGASHAWFRNIDCRLVLRLALPGCLGGALGALLLVHVPGEAIKPWIFGYLFALGVVVLLRAAGIGLKRHPVRHPGPLGAVAGFLDAVGGGGWGPIATSTLLARGGEPRTTIGSVNAAEFFVTLSISAVFISQLGLLHLEIVAGLLLGGVIAAPLAAALVSRIPARPMLYVVGAFVCGISGWQLWRMLLA